LAVFTGTIVADTERVADYGVTWTGNRSHSARIQLDIHSWNERVATHLGYELSLGSRYKLRLKIDGPELTMLDYGTEPNLELDRLAISLCSLILEHDQRLARLIG
jgi:hypothetical protein